jgi:hypothetical protein
MGPESSSRALATLVAPEGAARERPLLAYVFVESAHDSWLMPASAVATTMGPIKAPVPRAVVVAMAVVAMRCIANHCTAGVLTPRETGPTLTGWPAGGYEHCHKRHQKN